MIIMIKKYKWIIALIFSVIILFLLFGRKGFGKIGDYLSSMFAPSKAVFDALTEKIGKLTGENLREQEKEIVDKAKSNIEAVPVDSGNLKHPAAYYENKVNELYNGMQGLQSNDFTLSEDLYRELKTLNIDELKQIYRLFGIKQNQALFGLINNGQGDLIYWFKNELKDPWFFGFNYYTEMYNIWKNTGLWP